MYIESHNDHLHGFCNHLWLEMGLLTYQNRIFTKKIHSNFIFEYQSLKKMWKHLHLYFCRCEKFSLNLARAARSCIAYLIGNGWLSRIRSKTIIEASEPNDKSREWGEKLICPYLASGPASLSLGWSALGMLYCSLGREILSSRNPLTVQAFPGMFLYTFQNVFIKFYSCK